MADHLSYPDGPYDTLLATAARRHPDTVAIVFQDRRVTFREWDESASRLASGLKEIGLAPGDRVGLWTPNCPEYEIAFFGVARMGAIPTPLNPSYRTREVKHQLLDSGAAAVIVHPSLLATIDEVRSELPELHTVIVLGDWAPDACVPFSRLLSHDIDSPPHVPADLGATVALPYSSGTTGSSKGVMLTHRNLVSNALQFVAGTETTATDTLLIFLPLYHIYGVALMNTAVVGGATQVLMERFDLEEVLRLVEVEKVTEIFAVPPVLLALLGSSTVSSETFSAVRFIMSAAAPLAMDVARRVMDNLAVPLIQGYGMTESSPVTHMVPIDRARDFLGSVGVTSPDTECRIVDVETGERVLAPGEVGEVIVRGPQVMAGYWRAPDESAAALRNGWLYTGDIGFEDAVGTLSIVDRKKEMIKYKAFSIAPAELEALLLEHPSVQDCGVTGLPDDEAGEVPYAYVVLGPASTTTSEEILAFVRERVAGYKQIRMVTIVDAIPRTPSGKILRRVLKEHALEGHR